MIKEINIFLFYDINLFFEIPIWKKIYIFDINIYYQRFIISIEVLFIRVVCSKKNKYVSFHILSAIIEVLSILVYF